MYIETFSYADHKTLHPAQGKNNISSGGLGYGCTDIQHGRYLRENFEIYCMEVIVTNRCCSNFKVMFLEHFFRLSCV